MIGERRWLKLPRWACCKFVSTITPPVRSSFAPSVLVPTLALLVNRFVRNRGIDPNRPAWRERSFYNRQGLRPVSAVSIVVC